MEMGENYYGLRGWVTKDSEGADSIWVIVDRLTKSTHFLAVKTTYTVAQYAQMYLDSIVALYGVPVSIVSDRGP